MGDKYQLFTGNCPANVSRDAKYAVRRRDGEWVVELLYEYEDIERWHVANRDHKQLVEMVNDVKVGVGDRPGGPFYINEHSQVIVPAGVGARYYLAPEEYEGLLRFEFEGKTISGEGITLDGQPLEPRAIWEGPHHGIPYILEAGGSDIYYERETRPDVTSKNRLSKHVAPAELAAITELVRNVKGYDGGRFYINEWQELFAPITEDELVYRYIGHLEMDDGWFPKPNP
jgi:hypothetical protein